ncbi:hypothetical protein D3C76_169120 [compost metagenome]
MVINVCFNIFQHTAPVSGKRSADFSGIDVQNAAEHRLKLAKGGKITANAKPPEPFALSAAQPVGDRIQLYGDVPQQNNELLYCPVGFAQAEMLRGFPFACKIAEYAFGMAHISALQTAADQRHPSRQGRAVLGSRFRISTVRDYAALQAEQINPVQCCCSHLVGLRNLQHIAVRLSKTARANNAEQLLQGGNCLLHMMKREERRIFPVAAL